MTAHITKTWIEDGKLITEVIEEKEIYKRTWVGLTDEEIDNYFNEEWIGYSSYHNSFKEVMRWQEAKLKEKNA